MVTQPIENEPSPSKIGANVVPAFVVFQTPPDAAATYHVRESRGSTAMSMMRPDTRAGPIPRASSPEKVLLSYFGPSGALVAGEAAISGKACRKASNRANERIRRGIL